MGWVFEKLLEIDLGCAVCSLESHFFTEGEESGFVFIEVVVLYMLRIDFSREVVVAGGTRDQSCPDEHVLIVGAHIKIMMGRRGAKVSWVKAARG